MENYLIIIIMIIPMLIYFIVKNIFKAYLIFGIIILFLIAFMSSFQVLVSTAAVINWLDSLARIFIATVLFTMCNVSSIKNNMSKIIEIIFVNKHGIPIIVFFLAGIIAFYSNILFAIFFTAFVLNASQIPKKITVATTIIVTTFSISSGQFSMIENITTNLAQNTNLINNLALKNIPLDDFIEEISKIIALSSVVFSLMFYWIIVYYSWHTFFNFENIKKVIFYNYKIYVIPFFIMLLLLYILQLLTISVNAYIISLLITTIYTIYENRKITKIAPLYSYQQSTKEQATSPEKLYVSTIFDTILIFIIIFLLYKLKGAWILILIPFIVLFSFYWVKKYKQSIKSIFKIIKKSTIFILQTIVMLIIATVFGEILKLILTADPSIISNAFMLLLIIPLSHNFLLNLNSEIFATITAPIGNILSTLLVLFYASIGFSLILWHTIGHWVNISHKSLSKSYWIYIYGYITICLILFILILLYSLR